MSKRTPFSRLPILAITMGDPAGIGPEIIVKALASPVIRRQCRPLVIGSRLIMEQAVSKYEIPLTVSSVNGHAHDSSTNAFRRSLLPVLDPLERPLGRFAKGRATAIAGEASVRCIQKAVHLAKIGCVHGIVTAPINKKAIHLAGYLYPGHTEMLGKLTCTKEFGMMIFGGPLRIMFVTTHIAIRQLPQHITKRNVLRALRLADKGLRSLFGIKRPRIGVAGLNPHAGEEGLFGEEERRAIAPAVEQGKASGIRCFGPYPADTLFGKAAQGEFDGVVAMYHDQGLVALKTLAFGHCVNVTVGLPFIRTSVDHGTAYDIAGKGKADPTSLIEAITLAAQLATQPR
ncbi:MAG: 4-hydroxythreonine-4-phosphate dehydrogenase PdxA [Nitrospirales bacterium]|nr:4-hydroxythreonine-4-phosphate dehydrogenase PdxA [Nitrospira sp.]MDR4500943.1 4-hydroxythreonine-4-phosphate dehydrogenase PdxA [Nitrospirales bacterium]